MPKRSIADELAEVLAASQSERRQTGRALHDEVGPLLTAAGFQLQLLRMDFPNIAAPLNEVMQTLDNAMERVRAVSQRLNPSPVHRTGLKSALEQLVESHREKSNAKIRLAFASSALPPTDAAAAIYEAAAVALSDAVVRAEASRIEISVRGTKQLSVRMKHNGEVRGTSQQLAMTALVVRHSNVTLEVRTGKGTIVWINHDLRRTPGG